MMKRNPNLLFLLCLPLVLMLSCAGQRRFPWPLTASNPVLVSEVETLNLDYHRTRSQVLLRRVLRPTRANLDVAAYQANVMRAQPAAAKFVPGQGLVPAAGELFAGVLVPESLGASLAKTPLSPTEAQRPLAFSPLVDVLAQWNYDLASPLEDARSAVRIEAWGGEKSPALQYQEISLLYLHKPPAGGDWQWWVKIEFAPWARLFADMPDEDGDSAPEIYGRLRPDLVNPACSDYVLGAYSSQPLDESAVRTWANELASYWYPSLNTDIVDLQGSRRWPTAATEKEIVAELDGLVVNDPAVVILGKPQGRPVYNVFVIPSLTPAAPTAPAAVSAAGARKTTPLLSPVAKALAEELDQRGSISNWEAKLAKQHRAMRRRLRSRSSKIKALAGIDGFLFFRNSLEYVLSGDLRKQKPGKNPFPAIVDFNDFLAEQGVDFLLVPIPTKAEVYPDKISKGPVKLDSLPILNPHGRKFLADLTDAGVEVLDVLPALLAARVKRKPEQEPLYQPQDTHWTDRGLRLVADLVAERVRRYPWFAEANAEPVRYRLEKKNFKRKGDLVSRLAEREKRRYRPQSLVGQQVITPEGKPYEDDPASPVTLLGDSFTGVYQRTYCRHAGVSAHVAHALGLPIDLVMSYGGGPNVRRKLLRRGPDALKQKRLVIWMFAARDLYNYWEAWEPTPRDQKGESR